MFSLTYESREPRANRRRADKVDCTCSWWTLANCRAHERTELYAKPAADNEDKNKAPAGEKKADKQTSALWRVRGGARFPRDCGRNAVSRVSRARDSNPHAVGYVELGRASPGLPLLRSPRLLSPIR